MMDIGSRASQLWDGFWALPLKARIIAFVVPAVIAWIKRRALAEAGKAAKAKFWGWVSTNVQSQPRQVKRVDLRLVPVNLTNYTWAVGAKGNTPTLSLHFMMNFAHTEKGLTLVIKRAYLKGTEEAVMFPIIVPGPYEEPVQVHLTVTPVVAESGKKLKGKVIFVDQFNESHVSEELTFLPNPHPVSGMSTCHFCGKQIESGDQAPEAAVYAHKTCIWP